MADFKPAEYATGKMLICFIRSDVLYTQIWEQT